MLNLAEKFKRIPRTRYLGPAKVLETEDSGSRMRLLLGGYPLEGAVWARNAIADHNRVEQGDTVLAVGEDPEDLYVIGVLTGKNMPDNNENQIALSKGARAEVEGPKGEQRLKVVSPKNELIFQYDEKNGSCKVSMEAGDIEFVTRKGNITFAAGKEIIFHGRTIGMTGTRGVCLGIMDALGKLRSNLTLQQQGMKMEGPKIGIDAERGEVHIEETKYTGKCLLSKVDRLESIVGSVIVKAGNIYQTVEELCQMKAGRVRTLVAKTFHFKSKKAFVKAEEDYKIQAEKIHLG
ncbi:MAG: DUF3540 domain-containing protein [Deltaproteobacteria bacterium]|nr:DUF3540 domain-containing protein [Deltaproteobacteria bacterium]